MKLLFFKECPICSKKPGLPLLCDSCNHNRETIEYLTKQTTEDKSLEGFIKKLCKKIPEYLEECSTDATTTDELKAFATWVVHQTAEFKRIKAERNEYLTKANEADAKMQKYIEERWW